MIIMSLVVRQNGGTFLFYFVISWTLILNTKSHTDALSSTETPKRNMIFSRLSSTRISISTRVEDTIQLVWCVRLATPLPTSFTLASHGTTHFKFGAVTLLDAVLPEETFLTFCRGEVNNQLKSVNKNENNSRFASRENIIAYRLPD